MSRRFAVFDIDGTIIRWQLFHAIVYELAQNQKLSPEMSAQIREAYRKWKNRAHDESFSEFEHQSVQAFKIVLKGLDVDGYTKVSQAVFDEYKDQVYRYTRNLIQKLKSENYVLLAISGSPVEAVEPFADYYGFDDFAATVHEHDGKRYTGNIQMTLGRKDTALKSLVEKHGLTFAGSIGVGDSEGDIAMLALTENPIAFNPTKKLFEHAKQNHWRVALERKNMTYELRVVDGKYVLQ